MGENDTIRKEFVDKYKNVGEQKFYDFILTFGIDKLFKLHTGDFKGTSPELELLEYYNKFLSFYRSGKGDECLELAKIFRKAAHKIYRVGLKKGMVEKNSKFLSLVA
jgi:hypothetical protein